MARPRPTGGDGHRDRSGEEDDAVAVRVYCGVAAAEMPSWLTAAVVDDAGRLLDLRHVSDDPSGYAQLGALLADRSGGTAPVAVDRPDHMIAQLLAAVQCPIAVANEAIAADFAERFSDDTSYDGLRAPIDQRRAVGLARGLQAGGLHATAQVPMWDLDEFKPMLFAHAAVAAGRQAAAAALREVLRELYPAALRAYPDPAQFVPLKILEVLPEPGMLTFSPSSRDRDAALVSDLAATGVLDPDGAVNAISALRLAVEDSPRWGNSRTLGPMVAETVRHAVAAVRACDAAAEALVGTLTDRLSALGGASRPYLAGPAPVSPAPAPRRAPGPAAEVPQSRLAPRGSTASAAAAGVSVPASGPGYAAPPLTVPAPRSAPDVAPAYAAQSGYDAAAYAAPAHSAPSHAAPEPRYSPEYTSTRPTQGVPAPGSRTDWPLNPPTDDDYAAAYTNVPAPTPYALDDAAVTTLSFSLDPLTAPLHEPAPPTSYASEPAFREYPGPAYAPTPSYPGATPSYPGAAPPPYPDATPSYNGGAASPYPDATPSYPAAPQSPAPPYSPATPPYSPAAPPYSPATAPHSPAYAPAAYGSPPAAPTSPPPAPQYAEPGYQQPGYQQPGYQQPGYQQPGYQQPGYQQPGYQPPYDPAAAYEPPAAYAPPAYQPPTTVPRPAFVWNENGVPAEPPPPPLRLVERPAGDPLTDPMPDQFAPPVLRVIDGEGAGRRRAPGGSERPAPESDGDLLIFSQTRSAWFTLVDDAGLTEEHEPPGWGRLADDGWRAAEQLANPAVGTETPAGLPRRVPQANLVPGSAQTEQPQLRIVRDARSIAAHTEGYFRGWRRGQEIGGYAVGQRDRAAWEFNRDQRARMSR